MIWKNIIDFLKLVGIILILAAFGFFILTQIGRP
jgi:hypothetical protein